MILLIKPGSFLPYLLYRSTWLHGRLSPIFPSFFAICGPDKYLYWKININESMQNGAYLTVSLIQLFRTLENTSNIIDASGKPINIACKSFLRNSLISGGKAVLTSGKGFDSLVALLYKYCMRNLSVSNQICQNI